MNLTNFKLAIAIPLSWNYVDAGFAISLAAMKKPSNYVMIRSGIGRIDELRNQLIEGAKQNNCSHVLFLDTDHVHHLETIPKLLSCERSIVSGLSFMRTPPYEPVMFKGEINNYETITEWEKDSVIEVDSVGAASLLVDMKVFENIEYPYFQFWKNPSDDPSLYPVIGEDVVFCNKAKEAGYKIYVDTSCTNQHLGQIEVDQEYWEFVKNA